VGQFDGGGGGEHGVIPISIFGVGVVGMDGGSVMATDLIRGEVPAARQTDRRLALRSHG
jgi:hypothetical protein